jgi:hypothetical protein
MHLVQNQYQAPGGRQINEIRRGQGVPQGRTVRMLDSRPRGSEKIADG